MQEKANDPEVIQYDKLSVNELHEIAEPLFISYFNKDNILTPAERRAAQEHYNVIANLVNKKSGWKQLIIITPSTRIEINPIHLKAATIPKLVTPGKPRQLKETSEPKAGGKVAEILSLYKSGQTRKQIIESGFNKNTVNRQIGEYEKRLKQQ